MVTLTGAENARPSRLSVARAVKVCGPSATLVQTAVKTGPKEKPTLTLSAKNSTRLTEPSPSLAVAVSTIGSPKSKLAPLAGAVRATLGFAFVRLAVPGLAPLANQF